MKRHLATWATAATLALALADVGLAQQGQQGQQAQQAQQAPALSPELQVAGERRLRELLEVMNTGDYAKTRAYFEANSVPQAEPSPNAAKFAGHLPTFSHILNRYRSSRGLDLVRVTTYPARGAVVGILRNRLTGDEEYLPIMVEPQAPHRITGVPVVPPAMIATWNLQRAASTATTEEARLQEIRAYLQRLNEAELLSGAIIIARDGQPIFAQAYGYADRERRIPNTLETPFLMASMTKLFTGLAIGQLVEQGKLSYDDSLAKFLPDFPDAESARKIRIKHLLSHTAGLGDGLPPLENPDYHDARTSIKALVDGFERRAPTAAPGTRYAYSNMSFVLLGRVIEIVSGQEYYDYMQQHVFGPAGAKTVSFPLLPRNGIATVPMAAPYDYSWDVDSMRWFTDNFLGRHGRRGSSAGGAVASALDLLALSNALRAGRIVTRETYLLHSTTKPELGSPNYGYGFIVGPYLGRTFVGHNGRAAGHCTDFGELRDTPYTVIMLSNLARGTCTEVVGRILRVLQPS